MSYKHLAGRLVETQRSMLGQPAIELAQSVDGLAVTDDGNVRAIDGDGRAIVDELVERYVDMLGDPAEVRLRTAAVEFENELDLPASLGGSDPPGDADESEGGDDPSDRSGTSIEVQSPREADRDDRGRAVDRGDRGRAVEPATGAAVDAASGPEATVEADGSVQEVVTDGASAASAASETQSSATASASTASASTSADASDGTGVDTGPSLDEPVLVRYDVPERTTHEYADCDLGSVFLMAEDEGGWQSPITVADAILDAVTDAADLDSEELDDVADYVDAAPVLWVLGSEGAVPVSVEVEGLTVTIHPSGMMRVH